MDASPLCVRLCCIQVHADFLKHFVRDFRAATRAAKFVPHVIALVTSLVESAAPHAVKGTSVYRKPTDNDHVWRIHMQLQHRLVGEVATRSR